MAFKMRTSKPEAGNKFYITKSRGGYSTCIQGKPTDASCNVLANCVGYACGRFNEIIGKMEYPSLNCNAENFIERARALGLAISNVPTLGGIMVWQKGATLSGKDGAGHVATVEKIIDNNTIYTSESGYGSSAFWNATRTNSNGRWGIGSRYTFRGCIVNPAVKSDEVITETTTQGTVAEVQTFLNKKYNSNLVVDNIFGPKTKSALVKALQTEFNNLYNAKLVVDGIFGLKTKGACRNIRLGANGAIVYLIQAMLNCKGYNLVLDGIFGNNTLSAVRDFQRKNRLVVDGIVGKNTFTKLFA